MAKTMEPTSLDIDTILKARPKNRVLRIGVELEGAWTKVPDGVRLEHDGSVFRGVNIPLHKVGEIPIGPMVPGALAGALRRNYPQKVDATCGMHVHMSFRDSWHYSLLMTPAYQETMIDYLTKWAREEGFPAKHHIFSRLMGDSVFCQKKYWADEQVGYTRKDHDQERHGHRYTIIHYCGRQVTIECRVLPMMETVPQAIRAIRRVIDVTNACLVKIGNGKEDRLEGRIELPTGEVYEAIYEAKL